MDLPNIFIVDCRKRLFLERQAIDIHFGTLTTNSGMLESFETNLAIGFELHGRHLQHFRAILEAVLGCRFRGQAIGEGIGQAKQILKRVAIFVSRHATK